jgi:hypothetical protein
MKRYIMIGAIFGLVIPFVFWSMYYLSNYHYLFGYETVALWPSSFLLMATDGDEGSTGSLIIAMMSVAINILLFHYRGANLWYHSAYVPY